MGKGGSRAPAQPTEQNIVQSSLPKYFEPYAIDMIKRAESESKREYTPFQGQRLADENTDTMRSREIARSAAEGGIPGLTQATGGTVAVPAQKPFVDLSLVFLQVVFVAPHLQVLVVHPV